MQAFQRISSTDEPFLLIDVGRHGLVSPDFVRNTSGQAIEKRIDQQSGEIERLKSEGVRLSAQQDGLPVALSDADLFVTLLPQAPNGAAIILRTDRRLGFDPTRE